MCVAGAETGALRAVDHRPGTRAGAGHPTPSPGGDLDRLRMTGARLRLPRRVKYQVLICQGGRHDDVGGGRDPVRPRRNAGGLCGQRGAQLAAARRQDRPASARIAAAGLPTPGVVVTADDVTVGKPDPAPYLMGAKLLGFPPQRCLVVEDAPAGVASAKAAGSPVIGVLTTHPTLDAPTVRTLGEITFTPVADGIQVSIQDSTGDGTGDGIDGTG